MLIAMYQCFQQGTIKLMSKMNILIHDKTSVPLSIVANTFYTNLNRDLLSFYYDDYKITNL